LDEDSKALAVWLFEDVKKAKREGKTLTYALMIAD